MATSIKNSMLYGGSMQSVTDLGLGDMLRQSVEDQSEEARKRAQQQDALRNSYAAQQLLGSGGGTARSGSAMNMAGAASMLRGAY